MGIVGYNISTLILRVPRSVVISLNVCRIDVKRGIIDAHKAHPCEKFAAINDLEDYERHS